MEQSKDDPAAQSMRDLFELVTFYVLIWGFVAAAAYASSWAIFAVVPDAGRVWRVSVPLGVAFLIGIAIFASFDCEAGKRLEAWLKGAARAYAFPVTLLVGGLCGWAYHGHAERYSWEGEAKRAALSACAQLPACVQMARQFNSGNEVASYLRH